MLPAGEAPSVSLRVPPHTGWSIGEYRPRDGDHLCSVWTDPGRDRRAASVFLSGGPDDGGLWIQDPSRDHLKDAAGPPYGVVACSTQDVHLAGGTFDPERMYRFWRTRAGEASARGVRHLRAVAEMAWALEERPGTEHAGTFESGLTAVLAPLPVSVICQYGSTRFRPDTVLTMLLSHPLVVIGERVFSNPFVVPDDAFPAELARLVADPPGALIPMWRHFLRRLPTLPEVGAFLCNSLPSFIPTASVTVQVDGESRGWHLDADRDALDAVELPAVAGPAMNRLFAVWPTGTGALGGAVHTGSHGPLVWIEAAFDGHPNCIVLSRRGRIERSELVLFTTLASTVSSVLMDAR